MEAAGKFRLVNGVVVSVDNFQSGLNTDSLKDRKVVAKVLCRSVIEQGALTLTSGNTHVESKFLRDSFMLVDEKSIAN